MPARATNLVAASARTIALGPRPHNLTATYPAPPNGPVWSPGSPPRLNRVYDLFSKGCGELSTAAALTHQSLGSLSIPLIQEATHHIVTATRLLQGRPQALGLRPDCRVAGSPRSPRKQKCARRRTGPPNPGRKGEKRNESLLGGLRRRGHVSATGAAGATGW